MKLEDIRGKQDSSSSPKIKRVSYDIWFCQRSEEPFDCIKLRQTLASLPHTTESQSNDGTLVQFDYENPDTGVYCLFDLYDPDWEEGIEVPTGYVPAGLSVSINFLRPSFFAVELMPVIVGVPSSSELRIGATMALLSGLALVGE